MNISKEQIMKYIIYTGLFTMILYGFNACTDIQGDGIDTIIWEGSQLPEDSAYLNPVWEPDLEKPSVIRGATQFYAFGNEKEWSSGLNYTVPVLRSGDLMNWTFNSEAFSLRPDWAEGDITSIGAQFSKTLGTYYLFYIIGDNGIGVADSKAPQGPYNDYGKFADSESLGFQSVGEPNFIQSGLSFYLFFDTDQGVYGVKLKISRNSKPVIDGPVFKVASTAFFGVHIYRKDSKDFYLFGTTGDENSSKVYVGRATDIEGPYLDKEGKDLAADGGTPLLQAGGEGTLAAPGHVGGVFTDKDDKEWILYQATEIQKPQLSSGGERRPLCLNLIEWDENGWPASLVEANKGYVYPKFSLSD
jgi:arabinan endo-1,5-alpha-L-arabinosidase